MQYSFNYEIVSIKYNGRTRVTEVAIVNCDTGEVFFGTAKRHEDDAMNIALGTNLATLRAARKAIATDLNDSEKLVIEDGFEFNFAC